MSHQKPVRVLRVDDHRMMRQGLRSRIDEDPGLTVVAEADNGRQALEAVRNGDVDLVITDVGMPDMNGIEAARSILSIRPDVRVVALSMHADRRSRYAALTISNLSWRPAPGSPHRQIPVQRSSGRVDNPRREAA